ncbi:MAG: GNAT family N-acetyltransferase [Campylobacteraceae bacterium]|nr:GNAT family N-acetyltransferase [Campylobacteraceae bacterium]
MQLIKTNNTNKDFLHLTTSLDKDLNHRYGIQQEQYDQNNQLEAIETVLVGYIDNQAVACGCFKDIDEKTVEIKRIYVNESSRGKGFSYLLLSELEKWANKLGYTKAILEMGKGQPEALGLYSKCNYKIIDNYGPYKDLDNSICMEKILEQIKK